MGMRRSDSGSNFGSEPNRNVEWIKSPYFFGAYYLSLLLSNWTVFLLLRIFSPSSPSSFHSSSASFNSSSFFSPSLPLTIYSWTIINGLHAFLSFLIMHWFKGVPFSLTQSSSASDQGAYDQDTFWEQIDEGRQWTSSKKKFMLVPPILLIMAIINAPGPVSIFFNFIFFLMSFLGKLPYFHHLRIGGINKD